MSRLPIRNVFLLGVLVGLVVALVRGARRETRPAPAPLTTAPAPLPRPVPTPAPVAVAPGPATVDASPASAREDHAAGEEFVEVAVPLAETPSATAVADDAPPTWVAPVDGACPDGYPVKAKVASGIYHRPGGLSYERTNPDRCYPDEATAEADGYRAAQR